ncbi:MAG: hypothetical protein ACK5GV_11960 [Bacteroidota bacterium]|jgi:hypothetical protein
MEKTKEQKTKNKKELDESEKTNKKLKNQRKLFEQDLQMEEMLEDLEDSLYHMVKNIR